MTNPPAYTRGLNELIRAHRIYIGLSRDGMAAQLGMSGRTYDRIENGDRDCPPGFIDSVDDVVSRYEQAVNEWVQKAEKDGPMEITVSSDPRQEWHRSVIGRAAVESQLIKPVLVAMDTTLFSRSG